MRPGKIEIAVWIGAAAGAAGVVYDPDAGAAAPKRVAVAMVAVVAFAANRHGRQLSSAGAAWIAFTAWMAVSLFWGSPSGRVDLAGWLASSALLLAALQQPAEAVRRAALIAAIVIGAGSSLIAIAQAKVGARGVWLHGGQGNPDWLGITIAAALPLSVEWARGGARARWLVILAEVAGLGCARSRTAWIASALALAILDRDRLVRYGAHRRRVMCIALLAVVVIALGSQTGAWSALLGRIWIWRASLRVALVHFPIGSGLGRFTHAFAVAQAESLRELSTTQAERSFILTPSAHNDWLQAIAEAGIPALAFLSATIALATKAHRRWRGGAATLWAVSAAGISDTPFRQPAVLILIALVLAAIESPRLDRSPSVFGRAILCAACLAIAAPAWWAERMLSSSRRSDDPSARAVTLTLAARLDPASGTIAFERGLASMELHDALGAIPFFEAASQLSWHVGADVALGNSWLAVGDPERARSSYQHALFLAPGSLRTRINLAVALQRLGRTDEAEQHLAIAQHQRPSGATVRALAEQLHDEE